MGNKLGRNAACVCGSGIKYKRCCGTNDKNVPVIIPDMMRNIQRNGRCFMCGSEQVYYVGVFVPDDATAELIGQPVGKRRFVLYPLCRPCFDNKDTAKIEAKIIQENSRCTNLTG